MCRPSKLLCLLFEARREKLALTRQQTVEHSVSTLFDRGGKGHELIASYALELTTARG